MNTPTTNDSTPSSEPTDVQDLLATASDCVDKTPDGWPHAIICLVTADGGHATLWTDAAGGWVTRALDVARAEIEPGLVNNITGMAKASGLVDHKSPPEHDTRLWWALTSEGEFIMESESEVARSEAQKSLTEAHGYAVSDGEWPIDTDLISWGYAVTVQVAVEGPKDEDGRTDFVLTDVARPAPSNTPEPAPVANDSTPIYATHVVTVTARCEVTIAVNAKSGPAAIEKAREAFDRGDYDADHPFNPEWHGADIEAPAHKTSNLLRGTL